MHISKLPLTGKVTFPMLARRDWQPLGEEGNLEVDMPSLVSGVCWWKGPSVWGFIVLNGSIPQTTL